MCVKDVEHKTPWTDQSAQQPDVFDCITELRAIHSAHKHLQ
jgi:hypothetical protein